MDRLTPQRRSALMSRIREKNTARSGHSAALSIVWGTAIDCMCGPCPDVLILFFRRVRKSYL